MKIFYVHIGLTQHCGKLEFGRAKLSCAAAHIECHAHIDCEANIVLIYRYLSHGKVDIAFGIDIDRLIK